MTDYIGDYAEDATVRYMLGSHDSAGGASGFSSALEPADFVIYKNLGETQKTSTNGITVTSPFDSATLTNSGAHGISIDTSNDTG